MAKFTKYIHLERLNNQEVDGILDGICYVFPKIDGTNGSVWFDEEKGIQAGSRNRILSEDNDNAGFCGHVFANIYLINFFFKESNQNLILYGEWLVPHSLKTYRAGSWKRFYIFDVLDTRTGEFLSYEEYKPLLDEFNLDYIPPLAIIKNPTEEDLYRLLQNSGQFLVEDGKGQGEGIVIKNYGFKNKYDRTTWAKIVTNEFKEAHHKEMGAPLINGTALVEEQIVRDFLTDAFIDKERWKVVWRHQQEMVLFKDDMGWRNEYIPEVLGRVWHEFIQEEITNILKKYKNPKVNFKLLQQLVQKRTKEVIGL